MNEKRNEIQAPVLLKAAEAAEWCRITVGTLLVIMAYLGFVYGPMSAIANTTGSLQQSFASLRRVREILDLPSEHPHTPRIDPGRLTGTVSFENVSFSYDGSAPQVKR